jgi:hypothetical protein
LEQFGEERPFGLSEQQQPEQQEQQYRLPFGAPLSPAECKAAAEQTASRQSIMLCKYEPRFPVGTNWKTGKRFL